MTDKPITGYLIDPTTQTITAVTISRDYHDIYNLIDAQCFDVVRLPTLGDAVYIDDEGLLKDEPGPFFTFSGYGQPLAGKGLVLGTDREGETTERPTITLGELTALVEWPAVRYTGHTPVTESVIDHPILGKTTMISSEAIFEPIVTDAQVLAKEQEAADIIGYPPPKDKE